MSEFTNMSNIIPGKISNFTTPEELSHISSCPYFLHTKYDNVANNDNKISMTVEQFLSLNRKNSEETTLCQSAETSFPISLSIACLHRQIIRTNTHTH